ncbi:MAG: HEAT repeat domain-containing protein [Dehalococcoidia bacterium]|jgi:HEAT repeat protein
MIEKMSEQTTVIAEHGGETVNSLLVGLHSHEWKVRELSREGLESLGELALFPLTDLLNDPDWHVRWEAAKALQSIADPRAAPALVRALRDARFGVRWLAAEALVALKEGALGPLLDALVHQGDSLWLRRGAHRVLRQLIHGQLPPEAIEVVKPVLTALESLEPSATVGVAAQNALAELQRRGVVERTHWPQEEAAGTESPGLRSR